LRRFVKFAEHEHADYITTELALAWATQPAHAKPAQWANRLAMVRGFARYCAPNDPRTVVPRPDLLPHAYPTSTVTSRSSVCSRPHGSCRPRSAYGRTPMPRCSGYTPPPV
jgi:hypothetical protein